MRNILVRSAFLLLSVLFLASCGTGNSPDRQSLGSLSFSLKWQHDPAAVSGKAHAAPAPDVCVDYGLDNITAKATNASSVVVSQATWSCSAHQGTLTSIPTGSYTINVDGLQGSTIVWNGQRPAVQIVNGGNTDLTGDPIVMTYAGSDSSPLLVTALGPLAQAKNVPVTTQVTATFNKAMAVSTISESTILVSGGSGTILGTVSYDSVRHRASFQPSSTLSFFTVYTATITTGVTDMTGRSLASAATWTFKTESDPVSSPTASPSGVTAVGGDTKTTLSWSATAGATVYNVYYSTTDPSVNKSSYEGSLPGIGALTVDHSSLPNGKKYYYVVVAQNSFGEGPDSTVVNATPGTPTNVSATPGNAQVALSWDSMTAAQSYKIYWGTSALVSTISNSGVISVPSTTTAYVHTGRANGTTYYYVVTGAYASGDSAASSVVSAKPVSPLTTGLAAYYSFDVDASDLQGSNNATVRGIVSHTTTSALLGGGAYSFPGGNNNNIEASMTGIPSGNSARSFSVWLKPIVDSNTHLAFMSGTLTGFHDFGVYISASNNISFSMEGTTTESSSALTSNALYHVVITYDGSTARLYLNGSEVLTKSSLTLTTSGTTFYIGSEDMRSNTYKGIMDEIGVWSRALSAAEVQSLYNSGAGLAYPF